MIESSTIFFQLAIVLGLSALLGYVVRILRLPLMVAYLLAGVLLSFGQIFDIGTSPALTFLPEIGIAFVLFFIGMELDLTELKNLGRPILVTGLGQIILSILAGSIIAGSFGFTRVESIYLGVGLSFSSTIVVIKLLMEKKDLSSLYGKLSLGILLLEDLVAILILMGLTVSSSVFHLGLQDNLPFLSFLLKGAFLLTLSLVLSRYVLTRVFGAVAKSSELLFLSALAWCFIFVAFSLILGFSVVIGAFLAGVALANSPFHYEVQGKFKPLRDFFVMLFFVYLGSQVRFNHLGEVLPVIAVFTAYAMIAKPLIFLLILGTFGFRKHTIFQTALNLSQISEFSLIIIIIGMKFGVVSEPILTIMALTGVVSIISSSIMIAFSRQIYAALKPLIGFFEHGSMIHETERRSTEVELLDHVILVGAHRIGGQIMKFLRREKIPFLVLDFNPDIVEYLVSTNTPVLYGDVGDTEILEFLNLEKARLVISTAGDVDDNLMLLTEAKKRRARAVVVVRASSVGEARELYEAGADYVIFPEIVSGDYLVQTLKEHWPNLNFLTNRSETELNKLSKNHLALE